MNDFFNVKKTGNVILWVGGILGLFVGASTLMEGNTVPGLIWLGIAIFCFYTIWQRKKEKALVSDSTASTTKKMDKKWKIIIGGVVVLFVVFAIVANYQNQGQTVSQEWARINSPDGKISVDLPKNPVFYPSTTGQIEGYSYLAYDQDSKIAYVVKYENYQVSVKESGVELVNASEEVKQKFLKLLVDSTVKDIPVSNFSSEFFNYRGYSSIRYGGEITKGSEKGNMKGIIILVGESAYTISVLEKTGYKADFDRVMSSLVIK